MKHLQSRTLLVLGLGESGLAMALWCHRQGAQVRVWDSREAPPQAAALREAAPEVALQCGGEADTAGIEDTHLVLKSPGLAPHDERIAAVLAAARTHDISVWGELDLFAHALAELKEARAYAPQVLAITGTNGKTTTTALTALLAERAGKRVALAGNIGPTLLDTLWRHLQAQQALDAEEAQEALEAREAQAPEAVHVAAQPGAPEDTAAVDDAAEALQSEPAAPAVAAAPAQPPVPINQALPEIWVLELSSFQLHGVQGFEPTAATVLNLTQDHLDWHGDMAAYGADKARVFGQQGLMVLNRDDAAVMAMRPAPVPVPGPKPRAGKPVKTTQRPALTFGLDAPTRAGDFGLVEENGMAWLVRALAVDETRKLRADEEEEIYLQRLMPADALRMRGRHNAANALAALALTTAAGCTLAPMLHGLREYRGEPHRVEFVAQVGEVEAFDDSKGTNVGATVAALRGLGADKAPAKLVVILGGDGKGQDFTPLAAPLAQYARAVALIGRDAERIAEAALPAGLPAQRHDSLEAATAWCFAQAQPGDAVLLSPACASLDMFRNYGHRAEVFVQAVRAQAEAGGEVL